MTVQKRMIEVLFLFTAAPHLSFCFLVFNVSEEAFLPVVSLKDTLGVLVAAGAAADVDRPATAGGWWPWVRSVPLTLMSGSPNTAP